MKRLMRPKPKLIAVKRRLFHRLKTVEREASYVVVASPGEIFRLHRAGSYGGWMGRKRDFRDATEFDAKPRTSRYTHVCKLCWPPKADDEDSESGEASSAHTTDSEEIRCYMGFGEGLGGLGLGPTWMGQPSLRFRRWIRLGTGLDSNARVHLLLSATAAFLWTDASPRN